MDFWDTAIGRRFLNHEDWNSVRERILFLGLIYPNKWKAWALGNICRDAWARDYGCLPRKRLLPKTNGQGSHVFAIYPTSYWHVIDGICQRHLDSPQGFLPFPDDNDDLPGD